MEMITHSIISGGNSSDSSKRRFVRGKGVAHAQRGQLEAALLDFRTAIRLAPSEVATSSVAVTSITRVERTGGQLPFTTKPCASIRVITLRTATEE